MKELYELKGEGCSIRGIARELGISRNTVRKYVRSPEVPKPRTRPKRGTKLDAYKEYIDGRLADGCETSPQASAAEGDGAVRDRSG